MRREWENAVHRESISDLQRLLLGGCDIDARDHYGQTALMLAAIDGSGRVVAWLVEHGAALDRTAKYGLSALMLAVVRGHVDVVRKLTAAGASLSLRGTGVSSFSGKTALDLALARDEPEMIEILQSASENRGKR
jgi:uncharacterized protein